MCPDRVVIVFKQVNFTVITTPTLRSVIRQDTLSITRPSKVMVKSSNVIKSFRIRKSYP